MARLPNWKVVHFIQVYLTHSTDCLKSSSWRQPVDVADRERIYHNYKNYHIPLELSREDKGQFVENGISFGLEAYYLCLLFKYQSVDQTEGNGYNSKIARKPTQHYMKQN